jgi:hypothetical protein
VAEGLGDVSSAVMAGLAVAFFEQAQNEVPREGGPIAGEGHAAVRASGEETGGGGLAPGALRQAKLVVALRQGEIASVVWRALRRLVFSAARNRAKRQSAVEEAIQAQFRLLSESRGRVERRQALSTEGQQALGGGSVLREQRSGPEVIAALYAAGRTTGGLSSGISMAMVAFTQAAEDASGAGGPLAGPLVALVEAIVAGVDRIIVEQEEDGQPSARGDGGAGGLAHSHKDRVLEVSIWWDMKRGVCLPRVRSGCRSASAQNRFRRCG